MTTRIGAMASLARGALLALPMLLLGGCVESMFFHPDRVRYETPSALGLRYEPVVFRSSDGTALSGWFIPATGRADPRQAKGTVIHLHGNAQNMSAHWRFVAWLPAQDYNVFVFDYRGYGESEGKAEARGVFEDSKSAIAYVRSRADIDPARLLVFGQSLGGTNAIAAVGAGERQGVRAVAIESTFYSYSSIASEVLPGAGMLVGDTYASSKYVAAIAPIPGALHPRHGRPRGSPRAFAAPSCRRARSEAAGGSGRRRPPRADERPALRHPLPARADRLLRRRFERRLEQPARQHHEAGGGDGESDELANVFHALDVRSDGSD